MTSRRVVILLTGMTVAALGLVFTFTQWDDASRVATIASAVASVAAVGVAVWAALPSGGAGVRATRTGSATATGTASQANSGAMGTAATTLGPAVLDRTGDANASGGGVANTGVDQRP
jgi:hypothetical protein